MFFNYIIDHIPLWMWVTGGCLAAAAAFYFASPILIPLWNITPKPIRWALAGAGSIFLALMAGRYKGRHDAEEEQRRRDSQALQNRTEVDHEVGNLSDKDTHDRLSKFNRD